MTEKRQKIQINSAHTLDDLTSVGKTIMPLAKQLLGTKGLMEVEIISSWTKIVGEDLAQYSLPQRIIFRKDERTNGCLELLVLSGAFAMELKQREIRIIESVNTYFGYTAINKLKIIQTSTPDNFLLKKNTENLKKNLVSSSEKCYIMELTRGINSPELREKLESLGQAVFNSIKK